MRTLEDYQLILTLWEQGWSKRAISLQTDIPRRTVIDCIVKFGSLAGLQASIESKTQNTAALAIIGILREGSDSQHEYLREAYAYLLGMYLGDGNIVRMRRVYRLRVTLDAEYPGIIQRCRVTIQTLLPNNDVGIVEHYYKDELSCVDVSSYYKYWTSLLPQHGAGMKHTRPICLEPWQQRIVDNHPLELFRGLYHSDGSRSQNIVNGKDYPRYSFTNNSTDISRLFCDTCDRLGLHWTTKARKLNGEIRTTDVFISKRKDVEYLDRVIGPKS